jgi:WD40 repeat protein
MTSDIMRFQLIRNHLGHQDAICALAPVPGHKVLSAACDGILKEWDLRRETHDLIHNERDPYITTLAVFPAGYFFASGDSQGHLKLWNLETGEIVRTMDGHTGAISALAITHDGRHLLSSSQDHTLRVWDALTGDIRHVHRDHQTGVASLVVTPDDQQVLVSEMGSPEAPAHVKTWQIGTGMLVSDQAPPEGASQGLLLMRDGKRVISHTPAGLIVIWHRETGEVLTRVRPDAGPVFTALMPDESHLIVAAQTPALSLWSLDRGENVSLLDEPPAPVTHIAVTPDGRSVIAGGLDGSLTIYMRVS